MEPNNESHLHRTAGCSTEGLGAIPIGPFKEENCLLF